MCKAIGLYPFDFDCGNASDFLLKMRPLKYSNARHRAIEERRHKDVLTRLSHLSPERLDELVRER
ncbi:MAG: hypothetical protein IPL75_09755 [Acidobacteria bacterium]|nr:hypothetical protein [Acidobacteriota bacterium]